MNRSIVAGSTLTTLVLGASLLRIAAPPSQPPIAPPAPVTKTPSASRRELAKAEPKEDRVGQEGPWKASQGYFAGMFPKGECSSGAVGAAKQHSMASPGDITSSLQKEQQKAAVSAAQRQLWCIPSDQHVQAMIAILPDPVNSHLALFFDRTVEAIQLAAQDEDYVVDRYWLPWEVSPPRADWADHDSFQGAIQNQKEKQRQPGLLLFRWNKSQEEALKEGKAIVLYVFLVADTSTAGINGEQFSRAVDYVSEVCRMSRDCNNSGTIHIMGPTFSGSLASLRRLVEARTLYHRKDPQDFVVYSGTVSSLCAQRNQGLLKDPSLFEDSNELCNPYPEYNAPQHLLFQSFARSSETGVTQFTKLLKDAKLVKCDEKPQLAILSEAATTYGQATGEHGPPLQGAEKNKNELPSQATQGDCATHFSYPREIASLRNASQGVAKPGSTTSSSPGPAWPYLPMNLADQTNRSDEPPGFSLQAPLSQEAVLMNYASEMRRDHYKYIGISGTNILDVLFLAAFLRKAVPDARLFLLDADLLLERELDNEPYIGTLALTTYPLFHRHRDWSRSQRPRLPFSNQAQEGQYQAGRFTIEETLSSIINGSAALCQGRGEPVCPQRLSIWLTAVGAGGYWPVQKLSGPQVTSENAKLARQDFSGAWTVLTVFLCALGLLHCGVLLSAWRFSTTFGDFSLLSEELGQRLFFIHAASASLVLGLTMMLVPTMWSDHWRWHDDKILLILLVLLCVVSAALVLICGLLEINYVLRWTCGKGRRPKASGPEFAVQIAGSVVVWIVTAALIGLWHRLCADPGGDYGLFFTYRAVHLATLVCPLAPMLPLLVAIYLWAVGSIWRLRFNEQVRPRLNPKGVSPSTGAVPGERHAKALERELRPGMESETPIASAISKFHLRPVYIWCFALILLVWFFLNHGHPFELFERAEFGNFYETLFCVVVASILSNGLRTAQIWWKLKQLLLELNRSLVRFTFDRVKEPGWSPIWHQGTEEADWHYTVWSVEVINQIDHGKGALAPSLDQDELKVGAALGDIRDLKNQLVKTTAVLPFHTSIEYFDLASKGKRVAGQFQELQESIRKLQHRLARILVTALDTLQASWRRHPPGPKEGSEQGKNDDNRTVVDTAAERQALLEKYVALRYLAFIRAVLDHIRRLLIFLAISFSLLLISLNVYSFEPHRALIWSVTAIFGVVGFICVLVMTQAHRDPILSRITGTQANKLEFSFYVRIVSLGAVPLLTLLSTHFPAIGRSLFSFLQPGLDALK